MFLLANETAEGVALAVEKLKSGASALDAVEAGIRAVEINSPYQSVGYAGKPDITGRVTLDAAILCGKTFQAGSLGALEGFKHPISIARQIMEQLPHVMLAGAGAARFAREINAEAIENQSTPALNHWMQWAADLPSPLGPDTPLAPLVRQEIAKETGGDTTVFLAQDKAGNIAAASSSSGWPNKYPGRLGDAPVIGASIYADNIYGAAACTHTGEMAIRTLPPKTILSFRQTGRDMKASLDLFLENLKRLQGGLLAGLVLYTIDEKGAPQVVAVNTNVPVSYHYWNKSMSAPEEHVPELIKIDF